MQSTAESHNPPLKAKPQPPVEFRYRPAGKGNPAALAMLYLGRETPIELIVEPDNTITLHETQSIGRIEDPHVVCTPGMTLSAAIEYALVLAEGVIDYWLRELSSELSAFYRRHGHPNECAMEALADRHWTQEQRSYLEDFVRRWDEVQALQQTVRG